MVAVIKGYLVPSTLTAMPEPKKVDGYPPNNEELIAVTRAGHRMSDYPIPQKKAMQVASVGNRNKTAPTASIVQCDELPPPVHTKTRGLCE
mgnify:CR=1